MTFSIDNPGGCNNPFGKYVWEKPSGEQGLIFLQDVIWQKTMLVQIVIEGTKHSHLAWTHFQDNLTSIINE